MTSGRDLFAPKLGLTLPLCGLNLIFFFLVSADAPRAFGIFAFQPGLALARPWTFVTYQFLHTSPIDLFFGTMILYVLGMALEAEWGTGGFAVFWLVATLGASGSALLLGHALASGSLIVNVSMLFAYAYLFPDTQFLIFFVVPVKVKWMAWLTAGWLLVRFGIGLASRGAAGALIEIAGATAGFLFFWVRHRGRFHAGKVARVAVLAAKEAGALREDLGLVRRNRELFPKVEALRAASRAGGELPRAQAAFASHLSSLVVRGVNVCKPVDFKGDRDGICVKCEGFAECSLRYVAGQPAEIVVKSRD